MGLGKRCVCMLLLAALVLPVYGQEPGDEEPWETVEAMSSVEDVSAKVGAAVLVEAETGQCLYEYQAHARMHPASVTKIMTMLLVCEALDGGELSEDTLVTASAYAAGMGGSQIYLKEGEQMTVSQLLKSVAVASANDAAVALAEAVAGSEGAFTERMNEKARELGMADTKFSNCTGLPCEGEHLTSAWDIALMSRALLQHDRIRQYTTIWTDSVRDGAFGLSNTNKLVRFYEGCTGLKTGFTQEAMYCLSASALRDGTEYIAVILHGETSAERFEAAKLLLDHAFANYKAVTVTPDAALPPVAVTLGDADYVQPTAAEAPRLLLRKSQAGSLTQTVTLPESVSAPVEAGQELGTLTVWDSGGNALCTIPLTAGEAVGRLSFGRIFLRLLQALVVSG